MGGLKSSLCEALVIAAHCAQKEGRLRAPGFFQLPY
jgi:hypothetical protein